MASYYAIIRRSPGAEDCSFCLKCHCICEHGDEVRRATDEEFEEYRRKNPSVTRDSLVDMTSVIHKDCENLPFTNFFEED